MELGSCKMDNKEPFRDHLLYTFESIKLDNLQPFIIQSNASDDAVEFSC